MQQNIIDRTNRFYIDISKNLLSEREYNIILQMLINKKSISDLAGDYNLTPEGIRQIYLRTFQKVKSISELFRDIEHFKTKRDKLRADYYTEYRKLENAVKVSDMPILKKKLSDSSFPFSKRLWNILEFMDIITIEDMIAIPLEDYSKFRGFKILCKKELKAYIEFEGIEDLFDGFVKWSRRIR